MQTCFYIFRTIYIDLVIPSSFELLFLFIDLKELLRSSIVTLFIFSFLKFFKIGRLKCFTASGGLNNDVSSLKVSDRELLSKTSYSLYSSLVIEAFLNNTSSLVLTPYIWAFSTHIFIWMCGALLAWYSNRQKNQSQFQLDLVDQE
jgi:hypothetical protein